MSKIKAKKITLTLDLKFVPAWDDVELKEFEDNVKDWTAHVIRKLEEGYINRQVWSTKVSGKVKVNKG